MSSDRFDLRGFVRELAADVASPSPHVLAALVAARVPDELLREALTQTLPSFVTGMVTNERRDHYPELREAVRGRDRKLLAGAWWQRALAQPMPVYDESGAWKRLGDCTRDDLLEAVRVRREQAERLLDTAGTWEAYADLLAECGAERVRDLPVDAVRRLAPAGLAS